MLYYTTFNIYRIEETETGFGTKLGNGKTVWCSSLEAVKAIILATEKQARS
jgi:hypothetical protein